jgi:hypothetical protein
MTGSAGPGHEGRRRRGRGGHGLGVAVAEFLEAEVRGGLPAVVAGERLVDRVSVGDAAPEEADEVVVVRPAPYPQ